MGCEENGWRERERERERDRDRERERQREREREMQAGWQTDTDRQTAHCCLIKEVEWDLFIRDMEQVI